VKLRALADERAASGPAGSAALEQIRPRLQRLALEGALDAHDEFVEGQGFDT